MKAKRVIPMEPWTTSVTRSGEVAVVTVKSRRRIALVMDYPDMVLDARIIATAPELLEALKMMYNIATHPQATKAQIKMVAREVRALIAEAEGM